MPYLNQIHGIRASISPLMDELVGMPDHISTEGAKRAIVDFTVPK